MYIYIYIYISIYIYTYVYMHVHIEKTCIPSCVHTQMWLPLHCMVHDGLLGSSLGLRVQEPEVGKDRVNRMVCTILHL